MADSVVEGQVVAGEYIENLRGATVVLRVEESSRADAPSTVIAEKVLTSCWLAEDAASFSVAVPGVDPRATYRVTATVDLDGDGRIGRGDFLSVVSYPVMTRGHGNQMVIEVRPAYGSGARKGREDETGI